MELPDLLPKVLLECLKSFDMREVIWVNFSHHPLITPSLRKFDGYIEEIQYPNGFEGRKVDKNGCIKWENQKIRISSAFSGYHVGMNDEDEHTLKVWFSDFPIGKIDLVSSSFYTVVNKP